MRSAALHTLRTPQAEGLISAAHSFGTTMSDIARNKYRCPPSFVISLFLLLKEKISYMSLMHRMILLPMWKEGKLTIN